MQRATRVQPFLVVLHLNVTWMAITNLCNVSNLVAFAGVLIVKDRKSQEPEAEKRSNALQPVGYYIPSSESKAPFFIKSILWFYVEKALKCFIFVPVIVTRKKPLECLKELIGDNGFWSFEGLVHYDIIASNFPPSPILLRRL